MKYEVSMLSLLRTSHQIKVVNAGRTEPYQGGNSPRANSVESALSALSKALEAPYIITVHGHYQYTTKRGKSVETIVLYAFCFFYYSKCN